MQQPTDSLHSIQATMHDLGVNRQSHNQHDIIVHLADVPVGPEGGSAWQDQQVWVWMGGRDDTRSCP